MKIVRVVALLVLLLPTYWAASAQAVLPLPMPSIDIENSQRWAVKFAPLSMLDPNNTIQFGLERMLGQHHAIQGEFGYGWESLNLWRKSLSERYSGYEIKRVRAEWRYYWRGGPIGSYIAIEGLYRQTSAVENGTIGIGCDNFSGTCQFFQLSSVPIAKRVWAAHFKVGRQFRLSPTNNHWIGDFYGGIGFRGSTVERGVMPDGFRYFSAIDTIDPFSSTSIPISISYGIKFGYAF